MARILQSKPCHYSRYRDGQDVTQRGMPLFSIQGQAGPGCHNAWEVLIPDAGTGRARISQSGGCYYSRYRDKRGQDATERGLSLFQIQGQAGPGFQRAGASIILDTGTGRNRMSQRGASIIPDTGTGKARM